MSRREFEKFECDLCGATVTVPASSGDEDHDEALDRSVLKGWMGVETFPYWVVRAENENPESHIVELSACQRCSAKVTAALQFGKMAPRGAGGSH